METHRAASKHKDNGMIWIDECDMRRYMCGQDETNQYILVSIRDITHEHQQIGVSTLTGMNKEDGLHSELMIAFLQKRHQRHYFVNFKTNLKMASTDGNLKKLLFWAHLFNTFYNSTKATAWASGFGFPESQAVTLARPGLAWPMA
jgi:hypothetical protein